jgi:hypothetical protein
VSPVLTIQKFDTSYFNFLEEEMKQRYLLDCKWTFHEIMKNEETTTLNPNISFACMTVYVHAIPSQVKGHELLSF